MTRGDAAWIEFRVLGQLEARVGGDVIALGGAKQRTVLAVLLLQAGEVVSLARLIDEVWGESPPRSAPHSIEAYISRLRQLLDGLGPALVRCGGGYSLELGTAGLDARRFEALAGEATQAAESGHADQAAKLASAALELWRGPALADVSLGSSGRAEAERLEELRLRTFEQRFDAELSSGRDEELVGELQVLVGQNPYRERFIAQLMLALYRSGRQAEALAAYEQTRRRLDDDLGLQPSAELQQLSGQIVRQESELGRPATSVHSALVEPVSHRRPRRLAELLLVGVAVASTMALTASGSTPQLATAGTSNATRVALVLPAAYASARYDDRRVLDTALAFSRTSRNASFDAETLVTGADVESDAFERVRGRIQGGAFDLVLIVGDDAAQQSLARLVERMPSTHFVFMDASVRDFSLERAPNASAVRFADEESSHLAGYLSGLIAPRGRAPNERVDAVSVMAAQPTAHAKRVIRGFVRGIQRARPGAAVRVAYSRDARDPTACERLANEQINAGSDVVFAIAGQCGLGALAVARTRGIWGIGTEEDGMPDGPHLLATTNKGWWDATIDVLDTFVVDALRPGDAVYGLDDNYAVGLSRINYDVPERVWSKVVHRCTEIRRSALAEAP